MKIRSFMAEHLSEGCVTDSIKPLFTYSVESEEKGAEIGNAVVSVNGWTAEHVDPTGVRYAGDPLQPFTSYTAKLSVTMADGKSAEKELTFETGRMKTPWQGSWITDGAYEFKEKHVSPKPMVFHKSFRPSGTIKSAKIYAAALGIYELYLNGKKVGDRYFAPGFTSYESTLMYQTYDVGEELKNGGELYAHVAGGWAVGSFVFTRENRVSGDRQAFLAELRIVYEDGREEIVGTDESWEVSLEGPYRMADLYDGETYDATVDLTKLFWRKAAKETLRIRPRIIADDGAPVKCHETFAPVFKGRVGEEVIYDFGQNFAGVVKLRIKNAKQGQKITVRHAEILKPDGSLHTEFLRSAKATATYICKEGEQEYMPSMTYMGFRYAGLSGVNPEDVELTGVAMYSDLPTMGSFTCSDELVNRLQENIRWGAKSNLFDIPTDCPQRDERMGWTGDINVFAPTACYNFDMSRFLHKWMRDVRSEQLPTGGIPNTVPVQGYGFPATMPKMAIDWWGDACVNVPWAEYMARGDVQVLKKNYGTMKRYVEACRKWAALLSLGKHRYIWNTPATLHFGDWIAPDVPKMQQWQARAKWTATASLRLTSKVLSEIAGILGKTEDEKKYRELSEKVAEAYRDLLTDKKGRLLEEFQTGYVLPIYLHMFPEEEQKKAAENLAELVKRNGYCIGTGFPGTPYILFALADNGQEETAFRMLMNKKCPSWLYEVCAGATTIWERWDGLDENGECPIGDDGTDTMISYNHYASGAVGDFLYKRIAGIEATEAGYRRFRIAPLVGGGLTSARGEVETPFGRIVSDWRLEEGRFSIDIEVPVGTECELTLPDGSVKNFRCGNYIVTDIRMGGVYACGRSDT